MRMWEKAQQRAGATALPGPCPASSPPTSRGPHTCAPKAVHVYLLQQVHEAGVHLGQEAQEEDEWEAQGEHWPGGEAKARSACRPPLGPPSGPCPRVTSMPCRLTSGHVTGAEEEGGGEEREAIKRDGREGLSGAQGIQQPDEQTADAEVDRPAVRDHPVVALRSGPVRNPAPPATQHPTRTCTRPLTGSRTLPCPGPSPGCKTEGLVG